MSDALTPDASVTPPAVQVAPVGEVAVESDSAGDTEPKVVPVERFNGLMSTYQREKADADTRIQALTAELQALQPKEEKPVVSEDVADLSNQVAALTQMLMDERLSAARVAVLDEFPEAKPFADLIVGDSPEEMKQVASVIAERMKALVPSLTTDTQPVVDPAAAVVTEPAVVTPAVVAPVAPEIGGTVAATGDAQLLDAREQALTNRDFGAFLNATSAIQDAKLAQVG